MDDHEDFEVLRQMAKHFVSDVDRVTGFLYAVPAEGSTIQRVRLHYVDTKGRRRKGVIYP